MKVKVGTAVITNVDTVGILTFCEVKEIFVINSEIILGLIHLRTLEYSHHYHSWIVESTEDLDLLKMQSLDCYQVFKPCLMKGYYHRYFVTLKSSV